MTGLFKPCMGILPPAQKRLWSELKNAPNLGFTLYGGTAIALRLGHRGSVDFYFFSEKPLDRDTIQAAFPFMAQAETLQDQSNTWVVLVPSGNLAEKAVKVSFFGTITFGRVGEPDFTDDGVLQVASFDDLMATKLKVMLQRAEAKDYRDVAAMVNAGVSLARGLAEAARSLCLPKARRPPGIDGGTTRCPSSDEGGRGPRHYPCCRHLLRIRFHASL